MRIHCGSDKLLSLEFLSGYITVRQPARSVACCYFEILIFNPSRVFADHLKLVADNLLFVIFLVVDLFVFWVSVLKFVQGILQHFPRSTELCVKCDSSRCVVVSMLIMQISSAPLTLVGSSGGYERLLSLLLT